MIKITSLAQGYVSGGLSFLPRMSRPAKVFPDSSDGDPDAQLRAPGPASASPDASDEENGNMSESQSDGSYSSASSETPENAGLFI